MPELPEVEVIRRNLKEILKSQPIIQKFEFLRKDLRGPIPIKNLQQLEGQKITDVIRRAKYLMFLTERGGFLSSLGMTGNWRVCHIGEERKHDHVYIYLEDKQRLAFSDPRRFGFLKTIEGAKSHLKNLGPEPLSADFSAEYLQGEFKKSIRPVKTALMDNSLVTGIGNIYACETLYFAGVSPLRKVSTLKKAELIKICKSAVVVLNKAIETGGSSIRDFKSATGAEGSYQSHHAVYGKAAKPCARCTTAIKIRKLAGRSTFWCPKCQK